MVKDREQAIRRIQDVTRAIVFLTGLKSEITGL